MNLEPIFTIVITILQIVLTTMMFNFLTRLHNAGNNIGWSLKDADLDLRIARIVAKLRKEEEYLESGSKITNQSAADIIKYITGSLEAITADKSKDVELIISNDKINQGAFEISISYI